MPSTTIVLPYRAAGVVLGSAAGAQSIVTTGRVLGTSAELSALLSSYAPVFPAASYTWNPDGTVHTATENGVTTTYAYNGDGTIHTQTRAGVTLTFTYNGDGTIASIA